MDLEYFISYQLFVTEEDSNSKTVGNKTPHSGTFQLLSLLNLRQNDHPEIP